MEYPRDLLALQLVHLTDVLLGDIVDERDVVAQVLPAWNEGLPVYGFVLGFSRYQKEPLGRCAAQLTALGVAEAELAAIRDEAAAEMAAAVAAAMASPWPEPHLAFTDVQDVGAPRWPS